jgi:hypothetical protein
MPNIFISYRRRDSKHIAWRMADRLNIAFGPEQVFIDIDDLHPGENWRQRVQQALEQATVVLVIIGPQWEGPRWFLKPRLFDEDDVVRYEVKRALERGIDIIPVTVSYANIPPKLHLPADLQNLSSRQFAKVRDEGDFDNDMKSLIRAIEALEDKDTTQQSKLLIKPSTQPLESVPSPSRSSTVPVRIVVIIVGLLALVAGVLLLPGILADSSSTPTLAPTSIVIIPSATDTDSPSQTPPPTATDTATNPPPTATDSPAPSATPTVTEPPPTHTPTATASLTPTLEPGTTDTPSVTSSYTPTDTQTATASSEPSVTPSATTAPATDTRTPVPSRTPSRTAFSTLTPTHTSTPTDSLVPTAEAPTLTIRDGGTGARLFIGPDDVQYNAHSRVPAGQSFEVLGRFQWNETLVARWFLVQAEDGQYWVRADRVNLSVSHESIPLIAIPYLTPGFTPPQVTLTDQPGSTVAYTFYMANRYNMNIRVRLLDNLPDLGSGCAVSLRIGQAGTLPGEGNQIVNWLTGDISLSTNGWAAPTEFYLDQGHFYHIQITAPGEGCGWNQSLRLQIRLERR